MKYLIALISGIVIVYLCLSFLRFTRPELPRQDTLEVAPISQETPEEWAPLPPGLEMKWY